MCGICGVIEYKNNSSVENKVANMCQEMLHRGPDGEGIFVLKAKPSVGLGHRRLKVIDLSEAGKQPMTNEEESLYLVFNGEIYNYQELRSELIKKGHRFKSKTDAETVLHLYEDYSVDCLKYLRGMFSFAIWDKRDNSLFCARDRIGKKPFLYTSNDKGLCFASEFKALLAGGMIQKDINFESIHYYLTFGYIPTPNTIYNNVYKLPPAHYGIFKNGEFKIAKYWDLDYSPKLNITEYEAAGELIKLLKESTGLRLVSDVPLGAFLSGGIDSSVVVALMSQLSSNVKTFSIGFEEGDYNELKFANNIARKFSTDHKEIVVKPKAMDILPLLVERYGEPYADSSAIPSYYVVKEASKYVKVALNGDGGDESFVGYERYQAMVIAEFYNRLPKSFGRHFKNISLRFLPDSINFKNFRRRARRFMENVDLPFYQRYCRWVSMIDATSKNYLYSDYFKNLFSKNNVSGYLMQNDDRGISGTTDRLLSIDIKTNLLNDLLVKMDIACMANSLEGRSPFLDQKVMEFAARLPEKIKFRNLVKKYILKRGIKDLVPKENINRKKMGFGVPVGNWMRNEMKDFVVDTLFSKNAMSRGYFNKDNLKSYVFEHLEGKKERTSGVWTLLMLELWHQRFID